MEHKTCMKRKLTGKKAFLLVLSCTLLCAMGVLGTYSYLTAKSEIVTNTFESGTLDPVIDEDISGDTKESVSIKNNGNVTAYVRATVIVNWQNDRGEVYGKTPVKDVDYEMEIPGSDWCKGSDGYFYYKFAVNAGDSTSELLKNGKEISNNNKPLGWDLSMEIIAEMIQADGIITENGTTKYAVEDAWGVTLADGVITKVN